MGHVGQADDEPPSRLQHSGTLVKRPLVKEAMLDGRVRNHHVKRRIVKGQILGVYVHLMRRDALVLGAAHRHGGQVGRGYVCAFVLHLLRQDARAAVHFQRPLAGLHAVGQQRQPLVVKGVVGLRPVCIVVGYKIHIRYTLQGMNHR